jgi:CheY-like chemotaxis protein
MTSKTKASTRLLLCSSNKGKLEPLQVRLNAAGVRADCTTTAEHARQLLWDNLYDGVAIDLLMADRDGISFALELRQEHPCIPILVISPNQQTRNLDDTPDWLTHSAEHARLIFALKQASQRSAGRTPRILHVEDNDNLADLVKNTIGKQAQLFRARSTQEARIAMAIRNYDLALVRTQMSWPSPNWHANEGEPATLTISIDNADDPVLTILNNLRRKPHIHEPAYC